MISLDDYVIYVSENGDDLPAFVTQINDWLNIDLVLAAPYEGIFKGVAYSNEKLPGTWRKPYWKKEVEGFKPIGYGVEPEPIDVQKDDPNSDFFIIPDPGKNPTYALAKYWFELVGTMPLASQLRAAKKLIKLHGFENSCRVVKKFASRRYTLNWLSKNPDVTLGAL